MHCARHLDTVLAISWRSPSPTRGLYTTCDYLPKYTVMSMIDLQCTPKSNSALRRPICTLCWSQPETVNHKARSMHNLWLPTYCKYTVLFLIDLQCTPTRHRDTVLAINMDCQILTRGIWTTCEYLPKYTVLYVLDLQCTPTRHLDNVLAVNLDSQLQTRGLYRT